MADAFEDARKTLYRAPLPDFVTERKRLANELKVAGATDGSARVAKLGRPSVSAWAVNQLWWQEQPAFAELLAAAARVRAGEREATKAHKAALATLRDKAAALLAAAGNAASETTLRRIATTLSALAATGGFEPDAPGALVADRDPPGFETLEGMLASSPTPDATSKPDRAAEQRAEEERRRAEEAARQARLLERQRLSTALNEARALRETQQRNLSRLRQELETAEQDLRKTQALLAELEQSLTELSG